MLKSYLVFVIIELSELGPLCQKGKKVGEFAAIFSSAFSKRWFNRMLGGNVTLFGFGIPAELKMNPEYHLYAFPPALNVRSNSCCWQLCQHVKLNEGQELNKKLIIEEARKWEVNTSLGNFLAVMRKRTAECSLPYLLLHAPCWQRSNGESGLYVHFVTMGDKQVTQEICTVDLHWSIPMPLWFLSILLIYLP